MNESAAVETGTPSLEEKLLNVYDDFRVKVLGRKRTVHQSKWANDLQSNDMVMLLAPACHGKTCVSSVDHSIYELAKNRNLRIGILTATERLAEDILYEIKEKISDPDEPLVQKFGRFKPTQPKKWNKKEIIILDRVEKREVDGVERMVEKHGAKGKDANITVGGAFSSWKGKRLDLLIVDDLVDPDNASTPEKCQKLIRWFWETMWKRLEPWGRVKICGTVESEHDFYHDIKKNPRKFVIIHDKAIQDDKEKKVLWPEYWSYDRLAEERSNDYVGFMKHYQNIPISAEARKISPEAISKLYDSSATMCPHKIPDNVRTQFEYILTSIDLAWTKNKRSKYSVIMTVGKRHDGRRQILDIWRDQVEYDQLFSWAETKFNMLQPQYVIVETNQLQVRFEQELAGKGIPTIGAFTSSSKNELDVGIPMLYSLIPSQLLVLPGKTDLDRELCEQFISELLAWPNGLYSDVLMAYYMVEKEIRSRAYATSSRPVSVTTGRPARSRFSKRYGLHRVA